MGKLTWTVLLLLTSACVSGTGEDEPDPEVNAPPTPTLKSMAPSELAVGDTITLIGDDFPASHEAKLSIHLKGTYVASDGSQHEYDDELPLDVENGTIATFEFDRLYFHPSEDQIGTWKGSAKIIARYKPTPERPEAHELDSNDIDATMRITPSIILDRLRSIDATTACDSYTRGTNEHHQFELGFKAIGFGSASTTNPWRVSLSFFAPDLDVVYLKEDAVDFGDPLFGEGTIDDTIAAKAPEGSNELKFFVTEGNSALINPRSQRLLVDIQPAVTINQQSHDQVALGRFAVGPLGNGQKKPVTMVLELDAGENRILRRIVSYEIRSRIEIGKWDGVERRVQLHEPERTCGCVPGNNTGRSFTYEERNERSESMTAGYRYDLNVATSLGATFGSFNPVLQATATATWTESFGVDVNQSVSTSTSEGRNISIQILPTYYATCYRQLEELQRKVELIVNNGCGDSGVIGDVFLTNWQWGFDLAQGQTCDPAPPSALSSAPGIERPNDLTPIF